MTFKGRMLRELEPTQEGRDLKGALVLSTGTPDGPLMELLWSWIVGIKGIFEGSWGVEVDNPKGQCAQAVCTLALK